MIGGIKTNKIIPTAVSGGTVKQPEGSQKNLIAYG